MSAVPGFAPSTSGFRFANRFPPGPVLRLGIGSLSLPVGNASRGLCGGMVFAARDHHEAGVRPPGDAEPPRSGTPLFRYLVRRQIGSLRLPLGPLRYLAWSWILPRRNRLGIRGIGWRTVVDQWPRVRAEIDRGLPSPLGLIRTRSLRLLALARNHQVLAYRYAVEGDRLLLGVYDPNHPGRDDLALEVSLADPSGPSDIRFVKGEEDVYGFFRTGFRAARPPQAVGVS